MVDITPMVEQQHFNGVSMFQADLHKNTHKFVFKFRFFHASEALVTSQMKRDNGLVKCKCRWVMNIECKWLMDPKKKKRKIFVHVESGRCLRNIFSIQWNGIFVRWSDVPMCEWGFENVLGVFFFDWTTKAEISLQFFIRMLLYVLGISPQKCPLFMPAHLLLLRPNLAAP